MVCKRVFNENDVVGKCIFIKEIEKFGRIRRVLFLCNCGNYFSGCIDIVIFGLECK